MLNLILLSRRCFASISLCESLSILNSTSGCHLKRFSTYGDNSQNTYKRRDVRNDVGITSRTQGKQDDGRPEANEQSKAKYQNQREWLTSLAMQNAPKRIFELIGDPRSGLADNVTNNPFGELTVDMIHHQFSNEVYWYKYEFAGNLLKETHRDARLSEHAKNNMYILRAKDPERWTIEALAKKYHIRRQRVLAILALKEMEAHSMDAAKSLAGPLSAYAFPVFLDAVSLDPSTGELVQRINTKDKTPQTSFGIDKQIQRLKDAGLKSQIQLLEALHPFSYNLNLAKETLMKLVSDLKLSMGIQSPMESPEADASSSSSSSSSDPPESTPPSLHSLSSSISQLQLISDEIFGSLQQILGASDALKEEQMLHDTRLELMHILDKVPETPGSDQGSVVSSSYAGEGESNAGIEAVRPVYAVAQVLEAWEGPRLLKLVLSLQPGARRKVLHLVQRAAIDLNSQGVDLEALYSNEHYRGPQVNSDDAYTSRGVKKAEPPIPGDVFGYRPVREDLLEKMARSLGTLEEVVAGIRTSMSDSSQKQQASTTDLRSQDVIQLLQLRRTFLSVDSMFEDVMKQQDKLRSEEEGREPRQPLDSTKRGMMQVLQEAHPSYPERAFKYNQIMAIIGAEMGEGSSDVALLGLQELEGSPERAAAVLAAMRGEPASPNKPLELNERLAKIETVLPEKTEDRTSLRLDSWDLVAAFMESRVAGKVYHRGSGERHVVRLPTYPAFEGYALKEFDRAQEGEISQLNREVASREETALLARFKSGLAYNLGLVGQDLWDPSKPVPLPNAESKLDLPVVVYEIDQAGKTLLPALKVVEVDGSSRSLNQQELVFQERRRPLRSIPYLLQRIKRKPELQ
ncbi:hypothetical protein CEUSTIGMA_g10793.t1 [Chlamydomonas eustigma]|uniref:Uncharacterized protein n=1 Tax=Chlamydomonas eustigma TaxID=1157962 RepID=A0A250XJX1_9CHLO|nr:hypothetical protein CEUSTIGMA_g10793.t1 [Chlamydomonas eustigma]|eukprot:GAX83368.1 hypothetical protein CEUSTIGMA_g10793.t1 [Chlamydomonas eustigma]